MHSLILSEYALTYAQYLGIIATYVVVYGYSMAQALNIVGPWNW